MTTPEVENKDALLDSVAAGVARAQDMADRDGLRAFVHYYFRHVDDEDVCARTSGELTGLVNAHIRLAQKREAGESLVRVFTPTADDGFRANGHTVVQVVTDDRPFIVDTVTMELTRQGWRIHDVFHPQFCVRRDELGQLSEIVDRDEAGAAEAVHESWLYLEASAPLGQSAAALQPALDEGVRRVLGQVRDVVEEWGPMAEQARGAAADLEAGEQHAAEAELLRWLIDHHFTFLGYCEYSVDGAAYTPVAGSGLGLLRGEQQVSSFNAIPTDEFVDTVVYTKDSVKSPVHRPAYLDYIGVRRFDASGAIIGEKRFLGLLSAQAYTESVFTIPGIQRKAEAIEAAVGYAPDSQGGKALRAAIDVFPRDEFFQARVEQLAPVLEQIGRLRERRQVRLFIRRGDHGRFLSALVFLPRDRYNTVVREALQKVLLESLGAESLEYQVRVSESVLARLYFTVKMPEGKELPADINIKELEEKLTMAVRDWDDEFEDLAAGLPSDERGIEFPDGYKEDFSPRQGLLDLQAFNELCGDNPRPRRFALYSPDVPTDRADLRLKMFSLARDANLSTLLPHLDRLGVVVLDERPYGVTVRGHKGMVYDFGLKVPGGRESLHSDYTLVDRDRIIAAFDASYSGEVEADALNALVLSAKLTVGQVAVLRAISRYLQQAGAAYSQEYIAQALVANASLAGGLIKLFATKFDPRQGPSTIESRKEAVAEARAEVLRELDDVASLDHDKIIRMFLQFIDGAVRTNAYAADRPALAFKLQPRTMDMLPEPRPLFEIWVYSPRVEGVHLRFGKVARGGLRWSDRREDFRTEVVGLANAQMFKNTVIVPVGAKGGFYPKQLPSPAVDRAAWAAEGKECYKIFIGSLLSITDNIVNKQVVAPQDVVRYDADDVYLVVAADKGTATFSDTANAISLERNFWLGDAFASGGSVGYDHKGMGITARGAWESVKRHFHEIGKDCQNEDFTCVGIGDMAGDVFGNGMLLSKHTRLVAAFNHLHIFLDPTPDAASTWTERKRMFDNRLGWDQFNPELISEGGGVYNRSDKSVPITPQVREALGLPAGTTSMTPAELIHNILMAPVDLIYNGGIGTYVKASTQSHAEVGDKANDAVRVDGRDIRATIVGEGGNLGCTQLGRIEYAQHGGRINTDFIDNSAGVDTSDHEVNIKILLQQEISGGQMTMAERDALLPRMTDEIATHVLSHNIEQNKTLMNSMANATKMAGIHEAWMAELEAEGILHRTVQYMPDNAEMERRIAAGKGLTSPELCTLLAATKIKLFDDVLASDLPDDPYLADRLIQYFPQLLRDKFRDEMPQHRLHREIITTVAVNRFVDSQGITAYYRLSQETGASVADVMRAQLASRAIFNAGLHETQINRAQGLSAEVETELRMQLRLLVERGTRWLLHNRRRPLDITAAVEQYTPGVSEIKEHMASLLTDRAREAYEAKRTELVGAGVEERLAQVIAMAPALHVALAVVSVAQASGRDLRTVAQTYMAMADELHLEQLLTSVESLPQGNRWDTMSRAALRDDLLAVHAALTTEALAKAPNASEGAEVVKEWVAQVPESERKEKMLDEICSGPADLARMSVGMQTVRSMLDNKA